MKVLVTGGAGYVGQLLVPALNDKGHYVTVADWLMFGDWPKGSIDNIHVDIRDTNNEKFNRALKETDCIIHLASIANDPSSDLDPDLTWEVNLGGTVNIIRQVGFQRVIYASSSSVYGICNDFTPTEEAPLNPLTRYSLSKVWAERVIEPDIPEMVVVRPATLCGYSPRMRFDLMLNSFVAQAIKHGVIKVRGGDQYRSLLHIRDMVDFYVMAAEHPAFYPEKEDTIFNVVYDSMTILEIAQLVIEHIGGEIELTRECDDHRSYRIDGTKAKEFFDWEPQYTLEDAILEIAEKIIAKEIDPSDIRNYNCGWMKAQGYGSST